MTTSTPLHIPYENIRASIAKTGIDVLMIVATGSRAYGTNTNTSDADYIGIYREDDHDLYGLSTAPNLNLRLSTTRPVADDGQLLGSFVHEFDSVSEAHPPHTLFLQNLSNARKAAPAENTDAEIKLYPLREFVRLAMLGNPEFVSPMFTDLNGPLTVISTIEAQYLQQEVLDEIVNSHTILRYLGYARSQRHVVTNSHPTRKGRPELVQASGYDTKAASHLVRLLYVAKILLEDRVIELPMRKSQVEYIMAIRAGEIPHDEILISVDTLTEEVEERLDDMLKNKLIPERSRLRNLTGTLNDIYTTRQNTLAFTEGTEAVLSQLVSLTYHRDANGEPFNPYLIRLRGW